MGYIIYIPTNALNPFISQQEFLASWPGQQRAASSPALGDLSRLRGGRGLSMAGGGAEVPAGGAQRGGEANARGVCAGDHLHRGGQTGPESGENIWKIAIRKKRFVAALPAISAIFLG